MADLAPVRTWHCTCLAPPTSSAPAASTSSALIILNTPIADGTLLRRLWDHADVRICADGGANRLRDLAASSSASPEDEWLSDAICGDLDSLDPRVEAHFKGKGVEVIQDDDQYSTDLGKCLSLVLPVAPPSHSASSSRLKAKLKGKAVRKVTVHGGLSGRLDQTVHTLHALMGLEEGTHESIVCPPYQRWTSRSERERQYEGQEGGGEVEGEEFWVVDTDAQSAACCLNAGRHRIRVGWKVASASPSSSAPSPTNGEKQRPRTCGILPIGVDQAIITTKGLEWDLDKAVTTMTGMVSTSNQIPRGQEWVEVETDRPLIWTMDLSEL